MLFLPGTSFAVSSRWRSKHPGEWGSLVVLGWLVTKAFFAMPFFTQTKYLTTPSQIWIWTTLTAVVTLIAFGVFTHIINRQTEMDESNGNTKQDEEFGGAESVPLSSLPQSVSAARVSWVCWLRTKRQLFSHYRSNYLLRCRRAHIAISSCGNKSLDRATNSRRRLGQLILTKY